MTAGTTGTSQGFRWDNLASVANITGNNYNGISNTIDPYRVPGWLYYATQFEKCLVYAIGVKWNLIQPDRGSTNHPSDVWCKFINFYSSTHSPPNIVNLKAQQFSKIRMMQVWGQGGRTKPLRGFMSQKRLNPTQSLANPEAACALQGPYSPVINPSGEYIAQVQMGACTFSGQNIGNGEDQDLPYDADFYLYCRFWDRRPNNSVFTPPP